MYSPASGFVNVKVLPLTVPVSTVLPAFVRVYVADVLFVIVNVTVTSSP